MALTWASKVNGILTVVAVGIAVLIDLWDILDIKKGHSMVSQSDGGAVKLVYSSAIGILLETLHRPGCCIHRASSLHLSLHLLCPSIHLDELWYR